MTCFNHDYDDLEDSIVGLMKFNCDLIDTIYQNKKCALTDIAFAELSGLMQYVKTDFTSDEITSPVKVGQFLLDIQNYWTNHQITTQDCVNRDSIDNCTIKIYKLTNVSHFKVGYDNNGVWTATSSPIDNAFPDGDGFSVIYQVHAKNSTGEEIEFFIHSGQDDDEGGHFSEYKNVLVEPTSCSTLIVQPTPGNPGNPGGNLPTPAPIDVNDED